VISNVLGKHSSTRCCNAPIDQLDIVSIESKALGDLEMVVEVRSVNARCLLLEDHLVEASPDVLQFSSSQPCDRILNAKHRRFVRVKLLEEYD
jgi:hypothetical protein